MNIVSNVKKHDNFQLEFKTVYPIDHTQKVSEYNADVFFFLPRNLAVNEYSFSGREFYNDFSEYIRFKTPTVSLAELIDCDNPVMKSLKSQVSRSEFVSVVHYHNQLVKQKQQILR